MLYPVAMKDVGTDNLLLYALCTTAVKVESAARIGLNLVKSLAAPVVALTKQVDVKSSGSERRLAKPRSRKDK
jgi:hypothetical protein